MVRISHISNEITKIIQGDKMSHLLLVICRLKTVPFSSLIFYCLKIPGKNVAHWCCSLLKVTRHTNTFWYSFVVTAIKSPKVPLLISRRPKSQEETSDRSVSGQTAVYHMANFAPYATYPICDQNCTLVHMKKIDQLQKSNPKFVFCKHFVGELLHYVQYFT